MNKAPSFSQQNSDEAAVANSSSPVSTRQESSIGDPLESQALPASYGSDELVLMARDSDCIHAYWDIGSASLQAFDGSEPENLIVRMYDVSGVYDDQAKETQSFDLACPAAERSHYIDLPKPGGTYYAELGSYDQRGQFAPVLRSNSVTAPPMVKTGPRGGAIAPRQSLGRGDTELAAAALAPNKRQAAAQLNHAEYQEPMAAAEIRSYYGRLLAGLRSRRKRRHGTAPKRVAAVFNFGTLPDKHDGISSAEFQNNSSDQLIHRGNDFVFTTNTDIIVYGSASPGATVSIDGVPVPMRDDGTYSVRFALPTGRVTIDCRAESADGATTITAAHTIEHDVVTGTEEHAKNPPSS